LAAPSSNFDEDGAPERSFDLQPAPKATITQIFKKAELPAAIRAPALRISPNVVI
jgi:hypothetical protein